MASEIQNSNPTILNVADLPTRLNTAGKPGAYGEHESIFGSSFLPLDSFSEPSGSEDESDLLEEPIDEQEVYGKCFRAPSYKSTSS